MGEIVYHEKFTSDNLPDFLSEYKNHLLEQDLLKSVNPYLNDVKRFIEWHEGITGKTFNPNMVLPQDIARYRRFLHDPGNKGGLGKKASTTNRALVSLKKFFAWLVKKGYANDNPAENIKYVKKEQLAPKWLERNEQNALLRVLKDGNSLRDKAVIELMLYAGLRVSEVCSLERSFISISDRKGHIEIIGAKGEKDRTVPINSTVRKTLAQWLEENPAGPLFPNAKGKSITVRGVFYIVSRYAYKAERDISPHTLRHTFCKNLLINGAQLHEVAALAGHSSLDITKLYLTPSQENLQNTVELGAEE